ncbi:hypothetical protein ACMFMG_002727 [Clarireedia jacksonii]
MGCGTSKMNVEYEEKDMRSFSSRDSVSSSHHHNHDHESRGRSDERALIHRQKEDARSQSRGSPFDQRKQLAAVGEGRQWMREMTEEDYARAEWRGDSEEQYDELKMELDLMREVQEVERENAMMEREMKDIEKEKAYEGKFREGGGHNWEKEDYEMSPDMRRRGSDDRSYCSDVSSMSSMLSVLHESPEES